LSYLILKNKPEKTDFEEKSQEFSMRLLFILTLYPNSINPHLASYNRQLIDAISKKIEVRVIAPVLWFPGIKPEPDGKLPPFREKIGDVVVTHPRIFYTPGLFVYYHWQMYRWSLRKHFLTVLNEFQPDAILIGFLYPDASAVVPLCREVGIPYALRVNGSDFRIRVKQTKFRNIIMKLLTQAPLVFCPGEVLRYDIIQSGVPEEKVIAFRNGVDRSLFRFRTRQEAIREFAERRWRPPSLGDERYVLFAGNLQKVKGADRLILAWRDIWSRHRGVQLVLIGDGPERRRLERMARSISCDPPISFMGVLPHDIIALWLNLADCLCVPSRSEGMPNIVLESLASGTPVIATDVGEIPFVVKEGINGYVVQTRNFDENNIVTELARRIESALWQNWNKQFISEHSCIDSWDEAGMLIIENIKRLLNGKT